MANRLKDYFPCIREKEEILSEINSAPHLTQLYSSWTSEQQMQFLEFCTGVRGVKMLYDAFFKEIMNPETAPERLEEFLSLLLKKKVKIFCVLPNDSTRIADESSLLITDIVVQLEDGSLANVEVQKIGYLFPGERSACYSADLLLRQYKRVRSQKQKKFSYKDIKSVYTIVLFEKSPREFQQFSKKYLHYFEPRSNTGLELELLQKYLFIPLDIFRKNTHNKPINNKLDAWLLFLGSDDPEDIIQLIHSFPAFRTLYEEAYRICLNMENVMGIFSKELLELDRNTVQYMIDEMQETIDRQKEALMERKDELEQKKAELERQKTELELKITALEQQKSELKQQSQTIDQQTQTINQQSQTIDQQSQTIDQQTQTIDQQSQMIALQKEKLKKAGRLRIRKILNLFSRNYPAEDCANLLEEEISLVERIYECMQKHPEWESDRICEEIIID